MVVVVDACMQCSYVVAVCCMLLLYCLSSLSIVVGPCLQLSVAVGGCHLCSFLFSFCFFFFCVGVGCFVFCVLGVHGLVPVGVVVVVAVG